MTPVARTHYLVLPSYQIRLVGFLILVLFLGSMLHGFFLYKITAKTITEGFFSAHNRFRSTWEVLKPAVILTNGLYFLLVSLAFLVVTIFISHRLIGPIFKIAARIRKLSEGRLGLSPLQLRKGDEGQVLSDAVNQLQRDYQERFRILLELRRKWNNGAHPTEQQIREAFDTALKNIEVEDASA